MPGEAIGPFLAEVELIPSRRLSQVIEDTPLFATESIGVPLTIVGSQIVASIDWYFALAATGWVFTLPRGRPLTIESRSLTGSNTAWRHRCCRQR